MSWAETLFLKNFFQNQRTLIPGGNNIAPLLTNGSIDLPTGKRETKISGASFTPKEKGSVSITCALSGTCENGYTYTLALNIYKNDELYRTTTYEWYNAGTSGTTITKNLIDTFEIEKNAKYTFSVTNGVNDNGQRDAKVTDLYIGGQMFYGANFDFTSIS